jgi:peptidyl-prolyl cis-trans isomerase SurA
MTENRRCWLLLASLLVLPVMAFGAMPITPPAAVQSTRIVAVVNGEVISNIDVDNRARLFALSTGMPLTPDVLDRLKQQILRQLIDERLRMQEVQRRKVVIPDKAIAAAIHDIESRNGLPNGGLRQKLAADGVSQRTLIDQIRTQLGWGQVLREQLGQQINISDAEIADRQRIWRSRLASRNSVSARFSSRSRTPPPAPTPNASPRR